MKSSAVVGKEVQAGSGAKPKELKEPQADVVHTIYSKCGCKMELQTNEARARCKSMLEK